MYAPQTWVPLLIRQIWNRALVAFPSGSRMKTDSLGVVVRSIGRSVPVLQE
jgi:hypothetical protein